MSYRLPCLFSRMTFFISSSSLLCSVLLPSTFSVFFFMLSVLVLTTMTSCSTACDLVTFHQQHLHIFLKFFYGFLTSCFKSIFRSIFVVMLCFSSPLLDVFFSCFLFVPRLVTSSDFFTSMSMSCWSSSMAFLKTCFKSSSRGYCSAIMVLLRLFWLFLMSSFRSSWLWTRCYLNSSFFSMCYFSLSSLCLLVFVLSAEYQVHGTNALIDFIIGMVMSCWKSS